MFRRMLMTTVACVAFAAPALAQDQAKPEDAGPAVQQPAGQLTEPAAEGQPVEAPAAQETAKEATPPPEMKFIKVQEENQFLAAEEVIGKNVVNIKDEKVGTIADLVMDPGQKLVGVVLSVGGFLGIGDKWVAVAIDQIDFPTAEQPARLLVAVTEEQLKNAPDFVTRQTVEAKRAAEQAQQAATKALQQQQQVPPPATTSQ
jgi:sporulation protein YlmC with PRC-barrel domain